MTVATFFQNDIVPGLEAVGFTTDVNGIHPPTYISAAPKTVWIAGGAGLLMVLLFSGRHRVRVRR